MSNFKTKIDIFKGRLLRTVRKKYAEAPELNDDGKIIYEFVLGPDGKPFIPEGKKRPKRKQKKKKFKDIDYIFEFYHIVCSLDDYLINLHEIKIQGLRRGKELKVDADLVRLFREAVSFLTRRFRRNQLPEDFVKNAKAIQVLLNQVENKIDTAFEVTSPSFPTDEILRLARSQKYRSMVDMTHALVSQCFEFMKIPVTTKRKSNPTLRIPYYQFSMKKELSRQISKLEGEDADYLQAVSDMVMAQDKDLELDLRAQGYEVFTSTVYDGPRKQLVKIAYHKGISSLIEVKQPKEPEQISGFNDMSEEAKERIRSKYTFERERYQDYVSKRENLIAGVYSAEFMTEENDKRSYKAFKSVSDFKKALHREVVKEEVRSNLFPEVNYRKDLGAHEILFSSGKGGVSYHLPRYDGEDFLDDERMLQVTDGKGGGKGIRRILSVKSALVNGEVRDVIVRGRYKGFFLEDMINVKGRLIEGSYMINIGGELQSRDLIEDGEVATIRRDGDGAIKSRLLEPYITVSADQERLIIGIPSGMSSRVDRETVSKLSEEIATIQQKLQFDIPEALLRPGKELTPEQKKEKRQYQLANKNNPFYYFRPEDFEIVRDALGSVAMSKSAARMISDYFKKLTERDRALNVENLKRFTSQAIPGFKTCLPNGKPFNFNNKQVEAMAWMDANDMSGLMALDTGVGKTLLTVGAIQKSITDGTAGDKRFLMVVPKSLVNNLTSEARSKMDEQSFTVLKDRLDEMSYKEYTELFKEKGTGYFKRTYHACFFDEVNETFKKKSIFDSVSGLLHPRKVLLTASAIEKDPTDLYKFVTISQGVPYDAKKEKAWTQRYGNLIGGRFIGINKDPNIQSEFFRWVKSNAYFADKMDVDMEAIGRPVLQGLKKNDPVTVKMNRSVKAEYRKVSAELTRELQGMLDKYRDNVEDPEAFKYETDVVRRGKKVKVIKTLRDLANIKVNTLMKRLVRLSTDPENDKEMKARLPKNYRNPKLDACKKILRGSPESRVLFFTQSARLAESTAKDNALTRPAKFHAVLTGSKIVFYKAKGKTVKPFGRITNKTDMQKFRDTFGKVLLKTASGWNVEGIAEFIAENYNVATICCTDDYAKGFNLQRFQKVVHLDRGNGFDSETLTQRTARAFRAGQLDQVEEIFIDSTVTDPRDTEGKIDVSQLDAETINIQELQRLLSEKDQAFFTDIIHRGMNEDLVSGVDKVETVSGEELSLSRYGAITQSYVSKLLNPTDEAVRHYNDLQELKRENPITHSAVLSPERFEGMNEIVEFKIGHQIVPSEKVEDAIKKVLDLSGITAHPLIDSKILITVSGSFNRILVVSKGSQDKKITRTIDISPKNREVSDGVEESRKVIQNPSILFDIFKPTSIRNEEMKSGRCSAKGWGTKTALTQISTASKLGLESITMVAAGNSDDDGGYDGKLVGSLVWPKFGYDGVVDVWSGEIRSKDRRVLEYLIKIGSCTPDYMDVDEYFSCKVSEIISAVDSNGRNIGVDFWNSHYFTFNGSFDLSPNSLSMSIVNQYYKRKALEFDVDEEDLLTMDLPVFNLNDSSCWRRNVMKNREEAISMIRKYPKEFKSVYYSDEELRRYVNLAAEYNTALHDAIDDVTGFGLVRVGSSDSDIDDTLMKSIWSMIGERKLNISRKISALRELKPSKLGDIIELEQELKK